VLESAREPAAVEIGHEVEDRMRCECARSNALAVGLLRECSARRLVEPDPHARQVIRNRSERRHPPRRTPSLAIGQVVMRRGANRAAARAPAARGQAIKRQASKAVEIDNQLGQAMNAGPAL
jgi:hypothetical protein